MRERVHSIQRRQPPCVHVRAVDEGHANGGGGGGECCKRKAQARSHHIPTSPLHSTSPHKHQRMLHTHTHTHTHSHVAVKKQQQQHHIRMRVQPTRCRGERCCIGHPMLLLRLANRRVDGEGCDLPRTALLSMQAHVEVVLADTLFVEPKRD